MDRSNKTCNFEALNAQYISMFEQEFDSNVKYKFFCCLKYCKNSRFLSGQSRVSNYLFCWINLSSY